MTTHASAATILLDTNVLLWLVASPEKVATSALEVLRDPGTEIVVSVASAWEIAIKTRLGRLDGEPLLSAWTDVLTNMTAIELSIDGNDAILAGRLPWEHRDPFDRMIVAQAARRNLTIATRDALVLKNALTSTLPA